MKRVLKRLLICILLIMVVSNGSLALYRSNVYAFDLGATLSNLLTGLVGLLTWVFRAPFAALEIAIFDLLGGLFRLGAGDISSFGALPDLIITPFHILFNKVAILDVNFLDFNGVSGTVLQFRQAVAGWYYSMRLIATMVLLVILVYIGIRMAISTIASEKARYKKMLVDWVTSLVLLFLLHYIMVFVLACNTALVNAIATGANEGSLDSMTNMMTILQALMFSVDIVTGITAMFLYGMMVFQTLSFFLAYTKRMFTIGFLIIIAPLITITYSIDKIGDQKAQALNTWLKEFVYNILIQPFQCILYMVFAKVALDMLLGHFSNAFETSHFAQGVFAVLALQFIKEGEKIVKKIFGFEKASTLSDMATSAVMLHSALSKGKEAGAKIGAGAAGLARNEHVQSLYKNTVGKAGQKISGAVSTAGSKISSATSAATKKLGETKVGKAVSQKYKRHVENKNDRIKDRKERKERKSDAKLDEQAIALATQRNKNKGITRQATAEEVASAKKDIKTENANNNGNGVGKKVISGVKNTAKGTGEAIKGLGSDIKKYAQDNPSKIAGAMMGVMTAGMGFAAGDFLSVKEAVAGWQIGSGVAEGYYKNSNKTLQKNYSGQVEAVQNLTGIQDVQKILALAQSMGENDIGKDIKDQLSEIKQLLKNKENGNQILTDFRAGMVASPGSMNIQAIEGILDKAGFEGAEDEKSDLIGKLSALGSLMAYQQLSNGIENAAGMGIKRDVFADILSNGIQRSDKTEDEHRGGTTTTRYIEKTVNIDKDTTVIGGEIDVTDAVEKALPDIVKDRPDVSSSDISQLNSKLQNLEQMLQTLNSSNTTTQAGILRTVNEGIMKSGSTSNIENVDALRTKLESQISTLRTAISNAENSGNTQSISNN